MGAWSSIPTQAILGLQEDEALLDEHPLLCIQIKEIPTDPQCSCASPIFLSAPLKEKQI